MRIDGTYRAAISTRSAASRGTGSLFVLDDATATGRSAGPVEASASPAIDSLLALQSVEDPLLAKKKALRQNDALLDALMAIKADFLAERVEKKRLNGLMALVTQARNHADPRLDALLDDIELRARVELAKFGRFPGTLNNR